MTTLPKPILDPVNFPSGMIGLNYAFKHSTCYAIEAVAALQVQQCWEVAEAVMSEAAGLVFDRVMTTLAESDPGKAQAMRDRHADLQADEEPVEKRRRDEEFTVRMRREATKNDPPPPTPGQRLHAIVATFVVDVRGRGYAIAYRDQVLKQALTNLGCEGVRERLEWTGAEATFERESRRVLGVEDHRPMTAEEIAIVEKTVRSVLDPNAPTTKPTQSVSPGVRVGR